MQGEQGENHDFANGDAVIATDGGSYRGRV